jgi:hypothetical protein
MRGSFWNIRGLNNPRRKLSLEKLIKSCKLDFIGILETKKEEFLNSLLESLSGAENFCWHYLPAKGTTGGILAGFRDNFYSVSDVRCLEFSLSCLVHGRKDNLV